MTWLMMSICWLRWLPTGNGLQPPVPIHRSIEE